MISKNIKGEWNISGTNRSVIYGISSDQKLTDDTIKNGYAFVEMDTKKIYLYDEANKAWRLWENNYQGEDVGVGLNLSGAKVGQTIVVTSVDANGTPQAWTPVDTPYVSGTKLIIS